MNTGKHHPEKKTRPKKSWDKVTNGTILVLYALYSLPINRTQMLLTTDDVHMQIGDIPNGGGDMTLKRTQGQLHRR